jgi:tRNA dimethylallyltransferase
MSPAVKTAIIIAGPTAVGKTRFAINAAKYFHTEIISADSRQCYKELKIGVARPSDEELAEVPHHFIATHSIHDEVTAAVFTNYALQKAEEIFRRSDYVVIAGGTGLYLKAFCEGLDEIPSIPDQLRDEIRGNYEANGLSWLQEEVKSADPLFFEKGERDNPHRLLRALEIVKHTGRSILDFRTGNVLTRDFNILKTALTLPRETLYERINHRVDSMIENGLLKEAEDLFAWKDLKALQTVGYSELFDFMEGRCNYETAVSEIKKHSRHYAKRQLTWFRHQYYYWLDAGTSTIKNLEQLMVSI